MNTFIFFSFIFYLNFITLNCAIISTQPVQEKVPLGLDSEKPGHILVIDKKKYVDDPKMYSLSKDNLKCLTGEQPCNLYFLYIKSILLKALNDYCLSCTEMEKRDAAPILHNLMLYHPVEFKNFLNKYDTNNNFFRSHGAYKN